MGAGHDFINLILYRGDDTSISIDFQNLDDDPVDITGWTLIFRVKEKDYLPDEDAQILLRVTNHIDPVNGKTGLLITHDLTEDLEDVYQYGIQFITTAGITKTFARGQINFYDND